MNHPLFRLFALCLMVMQCTGCGAYRLAAMPGNVEPQPETVQVETIKVGVDVRIELKTGEIKKGEVSAVSGERVALKKVGNYGLEHEEYLWSDIQQIEVYKPAIFASFVTTAVGVFASYAALMIIALTQMGD
jgi:hypothetical protein|nr:hypothetical protein [Candidatus Krumholzibacteria bacterium]